MSKGAMAVGVDLGASDGDMTVVRFEAEGTFEALSQAQKWCLENDIAMGSLERDRPVGLMWGAEEHFISKWTRMTKAEQDELDGRLTGDKRHGPIEIHIKRRER